MNQYDMDARAHFSIADQYYYPDSDLETIQEEESVLDSEDGGSTISRRTSSSSFRLLFEEVVLGASDSDHSTLSSSSFPLSPPEKMLPYSEESRKSSSKLNGVVTSVANGQPYMSSSVTYNERKRIIDDESSSVDSQPRIVYAKCLTPKSNEAWPGNPQINGTNGIVEKVPDMFAAAREGDLLALEAFPRGELSDTVDEFGNTTLHLAAEHGRLGCVKKLAAIFTPQMISLPNDDLLTPAALAVKNDHLECVQWLVRHTVARDELTVSQRPTSIDGTSTRPPLAHVAARFDRSELLDWLCEEMSRDNVAIDTADHCSNTAVHVAARYGHLRCIQTLVSRGASVTMLNSDGDTPGQAAQRHGYDTTIGYLVVVETCVSLAQQLVALRSDMDGLKAENEKLRNELIIKSVVRPKIENAGDNLTEKDGNKHISSGIASIKEATKINSSSSDLSPMSTRMQTNRRILQEQPPPPKLWASPNKEKDANVSKKSMSSIRGHPLAFQNVNSSVTNNRNLQRKISEALNGSGTRVDGDSRKLRVSDVDLPPSPREENSPSSNAKQNQQPDLNNEVERITRDIPISQPQRKPWEKLTMDEMLRMVRDIRCQPSPSISMCTEDSTMEPVEVMRERMAAASHWFLVEKGKEIPKHQSTPTRINNVAAHSRPPVGNYSKPAARPYYDPLKAKGPGRPESQQQDKNKMQSAIQQQFNKFATSPQSTQMNSVKKQNKTNETRPETQFSSRQNDLPTTGTLKFKVVQTTSPSSTKPPPQKFNLTLQAKSPLGTSPKSSTSMTPEGTPPTTPPGTSSAQRSDSYRRAVKLPNKATEEVVTFSDSQSSSQGSSGSSGRNEDVRTKSAKNSKLSARERLNVVQSNKNFKYERSDPLQKRRGKDVANPLWNVPQLSENKQATPPQQILSSNKQHDSSAQKHLNNTQSAIGQPKYFNTWSVPRNNRGLVNPTNTYVGYTDEESEFSDVSEVPEMKTEIPSRQSSFLRKVQGKR